VIDAGMVLMGYHGPRANALYFLTSFVLSKMKEQVYVSVALCNSFRRLNYLELHIHVTE
jgi:hypothetical protein